MKKAAAELLRVAQSNYLDLLKSSNSNAYLEIAAFCLLALSLPAFLETYDKFTSNSRILDNTCYVRSLSISVIFLEFAVNSLISLKKPL